MSKGGKFGQLEAVSHIRKLLAQRELHIPSRSIRVMDEENWLVFERGPRSIGVDREAGVWQKDSPDAVRRCIEKSMHGGRCGYGRRLPRRGLTNQCYAQTKVFQPLKR